MGELGVIKTGSKRMAAALVLFGISGSPPALHSFGMSQAGGENKTVYAAARQDILKFESAVDNVITSTFSSSPFAVVQKTKGAYLAGYGMSFEFVVNIHRAVLNTPFGRVQGGPAASPELKKQRIGELKEKLIRVLQESGDSFRNLGRDEHITIIAFVEDRNFPGEPSGNKTIVLTALKRDIDEFGHQNERLKEFQQRIKIVEY